MAQNGPETDRIGPNSRFWCNLSKNITPKRKKPKMAFQNGVFSYARIYNARVCDRRLPRKSKQYDFKFPKQGVFMYVRICMRVYSRSYYYICFLNQISTFSFSLNISFWQNQPNFISTRFQNNSVSITSWLTILAEPSQTYLTGPNFHFLF